MPDTKVCRKCGVEKSLDDFSPRKKGKLGRQAWCRKCYNERAKVSSYRVNRDLKRKNSRNYYANHPEKRERIWEKSLERRYGLTAERYYKILSDQRGLCAVCLRPPKPGERLSVDHDHSCCPEGARSCGKCIRGLVHSSCNFAIGLFEDNPTALRLAAQYIERTAVMPQE